MTPNGRSQPNGQPKPIATVESVHSVPLEKSAAVCSFEIEVGERRIVSPVTNDDVLYAYRLRVLGSARELQLTVNEEAEIELTDLIGSIEPVESIDPFRPNDQPTAPRTKADDDGWGPESPWSARDTEYLLLSLVGKGVLSPRMARSFAATIDQPRGITAERRLIDAGMPSEKELLAEYSAVNGSEFVRLTRCDIDSSVPSAIPVETGREYGLIAVGRHGSMPTVALSDPQNERALVAVYRFVGAPTCFVMATRADALAAYERLAAA